MDEFNKNSGGLIFLGDFNAFMNDSAMASFCSLVIWSLTDQSMLQKLWWTDMYWFDT